MAGDSYAGAAESTNIALARHNADGTLDPTFGAGGKVTIDLGGDEAGRSVAIQSDGRIVVAGDSYLFGYDIILARYNANGTVDITFGTGGRVITDFGPGDVSHSVAIQGDGKIVVAGSTNVGLNAAFLLARYNANGSLDTTFGDGGKVTNIFVQNAWGGSVAIQGDGRIVVAGSTNDASGLNQDFAVARYLAAEPAPTPTPTPVPPTPTATPLPPTPTPVPGVGWPGLLALAVGLVWLAASRRARAGRTG